MDRARGRPTHRGREGETRRADRGSGARADARRGAEKLRGDRAGTALSPGEVEALQDTAGNTAVRRSLDARRSNVPDPVREEMEGAFGTDFSDVRVHTDSVEAARLGAAAYTDGSDIHFAPGRHPYSISSREILVHEFAHVLQQRSGRVRRTHEEGGHAVSEDPGLEREADRAGREVLAGRQVSSPLLTAHGTSAAAVGARGGVLQLWRDVPGQARVESTAPDTRRAWGFFMRAARQAAGGHAGNAEGELRAAYYAVISQRLRGSLQPISVNLHTSSGFNHHWRGSIRFVFGDSERRLKGGGTANTTLRAASGSSSSLRSTEGNEVGSSGSGEAGYSQGDAGWSGSAEAGGSGTRSSESQQTEGDSQAADSTSQVRQSLQRYSSVLGIEVNLSVEYDMGSSWTDYVNPAAYGAWGAAGAFLEYGSATGSCGSVVYYKGAGIAPGAN